MPYLLLIHIGPVQDFIASARRSRDLWYGSWLLSELAKAAAAAVQAQANSRLIFPAPSLDLNESSEDNVPNRIVAVVDTPQGAAQAARNAVWQRLETLGQEAFDNINGPLRDRQAAFYQVKDLPEFYWSAALLEGSYHDARKRAEALLAARKNTREFRQPLWQRAGVPKSSLDGMRESVIPKEAYADEPDTLYRKYGARRAEQLSGVDLLKRLGNRGDESRFPSTSHMAARPLLKRLSQQDGIGEQWNSYMKALPRPVKEQEKVPPRYSYPPFGEVDGSVLFVSRLAETLEGEALQKVQEALGAFLDNTANGEEPIPYYALLLGDGDGMGLVIDAQTTEAAHRQLSETLAAFAGEVRDIVAEHEGALVYAGGDDVLAFLPLHTALKCARALADRFRKRMKDYKNVEGNPATFSAAIVLGHHLEPLSDTLELARATEQLAKSVEGKNALAVAVDKRGGVTREIKGKWLELYPRLERFIYYQRSQIDAFPGGAAYELRDAVLELGGEEALRADDKLMNVLRKEGQRILMRKRAERGERQLSDEEKTEVRQAFEAAIDAVATDSKKQQSFTQVADELVIARLFARAMDQASLPVTETREEVMQ